MAKAKRLWLARQGKQIPDPLYVLWNGAKPRVSKEGPIRESGTSIGFVVSFCAEKFESLTGIKFRPGEIREVKSIKFTLGK
jgi:hypothetical protein